MPRGDKSKYTAKQQRMAEHIEKGYEKRGTPEEEAERRAWATVNKATGGGKREGGSGRGKAENKEPMRKGGRKGGRAAKSKKGASSSRSRSTSRPGARSRSTGRKSSRTRSSRSRAASR
jgi:hypothetical protein